MKPLRYLWLAALIMEGLTRFAKKASLRGVQQSGAAGKKAVAAVATNAGGGVYFSTGLLEEIKRQDRHQRENQDAHLTKRKIEIIRLIEKELNNKSIAENLFISQRTLETRRRTFSGMQTTTTLWALLRTPANTD